MTQKYTMNAVGGETTKMTSSKKISKMAKVQEA